VEEKLYYCVVQDYDGGWSVSSFGGRTKRQEREYALNGSRKCVLVTTDHDAAQRLAAKYQEGK
jgi:hypothetical protein